MSQALIYDLFSINEAFALHYAHKVQVLLWTFIPM